MTTPFVPGGAWPGQARPGDPGPPSPSFPAAPLGLRADLFLGWWSDFTRYIYQRAPVSITRGRQAQSSTISPAQASMTLNNRDGRFTIRNPNGLYYGQLLQNTPVRLSVPNALAGGGTYMRIEDGEGDFILFDTAALQITGNIDIRVDLAPTSYTGCTLAYKWGGTAVSWWFGINGDGHLSFSWWDGSASHNVTSTVPLPNLGRIMCRVTFAPSTGTVTFYTAANMAGSPVQLGAAVVKGATTLSAGIGQPVVVGHAAIDPELAPAAPGQYYEFRLYNSSAVLVANPVFTTVAAGATSFTDGPGNTWIQQGNAEISDRLYRFHGEMASLPKAADPSNTDIHSQATASGLTRRQQQQQSPINSAYYRAVIRDTTSNAPVAYWPAEDAKNASQLGAAIGPNPMVFSLGTPTLASNSDFTGSAPLPVMNGATFTGIPPTGVTWTANVFRFFLSIPSGDDTNNAVLGRMYTTGTVARLDLVYTTGGNLALNGYNASGSKIVSTSPVGLGIGLVGHPLRLSMQLTVSGGTVTAAFWGLFLANGNAAGNTATVSGSLGAVTRVQANANAAALLSTSAMGHFSVAPNWTGSFTDLIHPMQAWNGETAGNRFARLCTEEGINCRIYGFPAVTTAMGNQTLQTLEQLLSECETTDQGIMFEPRTCLGLGYIPRTALYNLPVTATASWSGSQLAGTPEFTPTSDDLTVINDVTLTNADGSSARQFLASGPMSIQSPPNGIGRVDTQVTVNAGYDTDLVNQAGWLLSVSSVNDDRYPVIPFDMARSQTPQTVPLLDVGSYLQVTGTPSWVPPGPARQLTAGYKEDLGPFGVWRIEVNGIPESPYEVAAAGTAHADTDGSTLHANITSVATTMTVTTTNSASPLWTTSAGDFPFDILMGGERLTVTNITGASSPQTFTVTRSVNGVVKAHTAGESVALFNTPVVAL